MKNFLSKLKAYLTKPGMFSRILVIFCIAYCVRIIEWGMDQFERSNSEAGTLITVAVGLFGTELGLLCLKRVFAKNEKKTIREVEEEVENVTSSTTSTSTDDEEVVG